MKTAYLVEMVIMTRVIVNEQDKEQTELNIEMIENQAIDKIRGFIKTDKNYLCSENIISIKKDEDVPFGTLNNEIG